MLAVGNNYSSLAVSYYITGKNQTGHMFMIFLTGHTEEHPSCYCNTNC